MTILCVDIGNAHTVFGLMSDGEVGPTWRVSSTEARTSDEWFALLRSLLTRDGLTEVSGVAVCATVPAVLHQWRVLSEDRLPQMPVVVVGPGVKTGVPVLMDNPREVGTDRVVNALAAAHVYGGPAIVVDFGVGTTFDVVNAEGGYLGGAIAPGVELSLEALGQRGAQLRQVELLQPRSVIAKNTVEALQSGVIYGFAGQVDAIVGRMIGELGVPADEVKVIATGHIDPVVVEVCETVTHRDPHLTLRGLELVYQRNL